MHKNIGTADRLFRLVLAIALLAFAWWQSSLLALAISIFVFYEAAAGWCILYQFLGKSSCPVSQNPDRKKINGGTAMIDSTRLGLAGGVLWGISVFVLTIISMYTGYASQWIDLFGNIYLGYDASWSGSFIGLAYGFIDAFIGLFILGWLYNIFGS